MEKTEIERHRKYRSQEEDIYHIAVQNSWDNMDNKLIPKDRNTAILVPMYEYEDHRVCKNIKGLSQLCVAYKMYEKVLESRLKNRTNTGRHSRR